VLAAAEAGWRLVAVTRAEQAGRHCAARTAGRPVLVIDSGLLHTTADGQWRELRMGHPDLGTVVRCLVPETRRVDEHTFLAHPDDHAGLRRAIRTLLLRTAPLAHATRPRTPTALIPGRSGA
jgi:hypothetical protein